jgi:hypothetical protein
MYYQYPIGTFVRKRQARSQLDFALKAKALLRDSDELLLEPARHGLAVFAAHEDALSGCVRTLAEVYADRLEVREPVVRLIPGEPVQQPVMNVRVRARREHAAAVLQELARRDVKIDEQTLQSRELTIRGTAPMADLLGLPGVLAEITGGTATHWIWLARYVPVAGELTHE